MIYKPEHIVDLESGAIIAAEVRLGDAGDTEKLSTRVLEAVELVDEIYAQDHVEGTSRVKDLTGDKGFHSPAARRQPDNLEPEARQALERAARAVKSKSGKEQLKKRGEHIERGFAHVLDCGSLRRTTLKGRANINKRYLCGILAFNLSLIMRKLTGVGTPGQAAAARATFLACYEACLRLRIALLRTLILKTGTPVLILTFIPARRLAPVFSRSRSAALFSTGS